MSGEQYDHCNLNSTGLARPLFQTYPGPNPFMSIERDFFSEWPKLVWNLDTSLTGMVDRSDLIAPTTSFSRFLQKALHAISRGLPVPDHLHTLSIAS
jgi:hypothetical protein